MVVLAVVAFAAVVWSFRPADRPDPGSPEAGIQAGAESHTPSLIKSQTGLTDLPASPPQTNLRPTTGGVGPALTSPAASAPDQPRTRRAWDYAFLGSLMKTAPGAAIRFELTGGIFATGMIRRLERTNGELVSVSGDLVAPEAGRFFFQKQLLPGKQGDFAGVVQFPASKTAWRIEPSGPDGRSELVQRRLDEVICLMPPPPVAEEIPPLDPSGVPDYVPPHNDGIISLQSLPGAAGVIYIDYRGGYNDNNWGSFPYSRPNVSNAQIRDVWKRVAEDYMPFNINVTTDIKVYQAAAETSRQRCICTDTTTAAPGAGGVSWMNSWNWSGDIPNWSFGTSGKYAAEIITHEVGHALALGHDGRSTPSEGYYGGQGSGAAGWAPIMGVGYYQPVAQWSKGEYANANNTEDDLAILTSRNNSVAYRTDDTGPRLATARYLELYSNFAASAEGVVETTGDTDAFRFTTTGGAVALAANPVGDWANLAIMATLADARDIVIASNNPQTLLSASISTNLPAGTYTFRVTGAGRNDPLNDGFSSYASLGCYSITGSVAGAVLPSRFTVLETATAGTVVGTVAATNPDGNPLVYTIVSGNTSTAFALNSSGVLAVANAAALNYEALALKTVFTVQFELFVNITNTVNPALTELNRRVVVGVLDVNEPPTLGAITNSLIAHTQPGTVVGTLAASDPDAYTVLTFSMLGGNSNNAFALNTGSGELTVAGDLDPALQPVYNLLVRVADNGSPALATTNTVQITVITNNSPFLPGTLSYAVYDGLGNGNLITDMTGNARFPTDPTWEKQIRLAEGESNRGDGYGSVMRGYLIPPSNGVYNFCIATDDNGELWMSTGTNPAAMTLIASITGNDLWAPPRGWTKYASQTSAGRSLVAGNAYYIEARHKEGAGGDNVAIGWKGPPSPGQISVIPALYLAPRAVNYVPHATGFTANVRRDAFQNAAVGRVTVADANTNDTHAFTLLEGNTGDLFAVDSNGWVRVASDTALQTSPQVDFTLVIRVTDSGQPALSTTASVVLTLVDPDVVSATTMQREMFQNIGNGMLITDLTGNAKYPGRPDALTPLTTLETAVDVADAYGSRARGFVVPSVSGDYQFFLASDDAGQLKLSPDENPANAVVIATVSDYSSARQWTKYATQTSPVQAGLVAGQRYYIEVLQKEGGGGDHFSVGWLVPGSGITNVIPGENLQPIDINSAPVLNGQTFSMLETVPNGTILGMVTALDSPLDTMTFQLLGGNTNNSFSLDPASGLLRLLDNSLITSRAATNFQLTVAVQDSGYGGLYPLHAATNTVTIKVTGTNVPFVWSGSGTTRLWSDPGNWGGGTLYPGVRLVLGQASRQANVNDAISSAAWVQFTTGGFACSGNPLSLQSGLTNTGNNTWGIPTTLTAPQTWLNNSSQLTITGAISNSGFTHTLIANGDLAIKGPVSGAGGITKSGSARLILQGTNSYTGPTTIASAGGTTTALEVSGTGDLHIGGSTMTLSGRMDLWEHSATIGGLNGNGIIFANNGSRTLTVGANNGSGTFSGNILNSTWASGVTLGLIKSGAGTQFLTGSNAYSGTTTINGGVLQVSGGGTALGALSGTPSITINAGATLRLNSIDTLGWTTGREALIINSGGAVSINSGFRATLANSVTMTGGVLAAVGTGDVWGNYSLFNGAAIIATSDASGNPATISCPRLALQDNGGQTTFHVTRGPAAPAVDATITGAVVQMNNSSNGLRKTGDGILALSGRNTYVGPTTVTNGTLLVNGQLAGAGTVAVLPGATLGGTGAINGSTTIQPGGTLAPGNNSLGTLTFSNSLVISGQTLMDISKSANRPSSDLLNTRGALTLGGALVVSQLGTDPLAAGDTFTLITAVSTSGGFGSVTLPPLPAGLGWTNRLALNGSIQVVQTVNTLPGSIGALLVGGTNLVLSWPADHTGWRLMVQTNQTTAGISLNANDWGVVPGSSTTNRVTLRVNESAPAGYFRLVYP